MDDEVTGAKQDNWNKDLGNAGEIMESQTIAAYIPSPGFGEFNGEVLLAMLAICVALFFAERAYRKMR